MATARTRPAKRLLLGSGDGARCTQTTACTRHSHGGAGVEAGNASSSSRGSRLSGRQGRSASGCTRAILPEAGLA
jgi:hypothetical protein